MKKIKIVCDNCETEYSLHKINDNICMCEDCLKNNPYYVYGLKYAINQIKDLFDEEV